MDLKPNLAAAVLISLISLAAFPALAKTAVFAPSFWDPHHRLSKPELGDLRNIRFLTEDDDPPFHFALPDGGLAGFDVDLARALCEELKVACTIQARRWDHLIEGLDENQGDALIAALRVDSPFRDKLDFTAPYYKTPARFAVRKAAQLDEATPEGLREKVIGVVGGSAHEAFLQTFFAESILKPYASQAALREALAKGEIDVLFDDGISLSFWLAGPNSADCCAFAGGPFLDDRFFGEGVGIAVKKDNDLLRDALNYALAAVAAKGIYTDLYLKYFPLGPY